jgi:UDP-N-acetylglucosamine acyltransferase
VIEDEVEIGENVWIDSHVSIKSGARIGDGCRIYFSSAIAGPPQDLKYAGEKTELIIGKNCTIREFVTLNRGTAAHGRSEIGDNCLIMAYSHVAHDCIIGPNVIIVNAVNMGGHVEIGDQAIIGGGTAIHQFCKIGEHAMVGAGYKVTQDILPYSLAAGYPIKCMGINLVGLSRRDFDEETISKLKTAFRYLMSDKLNTSEALSQIEKEVEMIPEVRRLVEFVRSSERGVTK